jgi:hypothetical protein
MTEEDFADGVAEEPTLDGLLPDRGPDPIAALHDVEAEAGDEEEVRDLFELDRAAARELGADLDLPEGGEPVLD